jgi:threonine/homoserine/homoserine lactone efflux protein
MLGISAGVIVQLVAVCAGLGAVFTRWPTLQVVLSWAGAAYLVYMGWRLLQSGLAQTRENARPITFVEAAIFQFLNPKAWVMSLTAAALFLPTELGVILGTAYVAGLMVVVNLPCIAVWALFGSSLRRFLEQPGWRLAFNGVMALALAGTAVIMVLPAK